MSTVQGYDILFKLNSKMVVGETSSSLDISAKVKESLSKADKGNTRREVSGHDVTFSINGAMELVDDSGTTTSLDADDLIDLSLKVGNQAAIPFTYVRGTGKAYQGNMIITGYSESSDADGNATYTLNCSVSGDFKPVTA